MYIEGIFVSDEMQSCGIGKFLLDYIKDKKVRLQLNVYFFGYNTSYILKKSLLLFCILGGNFHSELKKQNDFIHTK